MPSSFDEAMGAALPALESTFGSTGWRYAPASGMQRDITPIAEWPEPQRGETIAGVRQALRITVRNDAALGIVPQDINLGSDRLLGPAWPGGPERKWQIGRVVSADAGAVVLELL